MGFWCYSAAGFNGVFNPLLLFERKVGFNSFWYLKTGEYAFCTLTVKSVVVMRVNAVFFLRDRDVLLFPELSMSFQHTQFTVGYYRVEKLWYFYLVPGATEYHVRHQNFVFKCRSECTILCALFHDPLNRPSDAGDCF